MLATEREGNATVRPGCVVGVVRKYLGTRLTFKKRRIYSPPSRLYMCFEIPRGRRKKGLSAGGVKIMACKLATYHSVAGRPVHCKCPRYGHQEQRSLRRASRRLSRCVLRSTTTFFYLRVTWADSG